MAASILIIMADHTDLIKSTGLYPLWIQNHSAAFVGVQTQMNLIAYLNAIDVLSKYVMSSYFQF